MRIAVFGDIHGHWCDFSDAVRRIHAATPLDLVLQCGDLQPIRHEADLQYLHCPSRYKLLGDFGQFASGQQTFPVPLLFVGGNHEPWNFLDEHRDGGTLIQNVEFIGRAGLRTVGGVRIAGVSGVYSPKDHEQPHPEPPYPPNKAKQATHYNHADIDKAMEIGRVDILLMHEWPSLMNEVHDAPLPERWGLVGSEPLSMLVELLEPRYVFCGHMHHAATGTHKGSRIVCLGDFSAGTSTQSYLTFEI